MQARPPPGGSAHHDPPTAPGALHQGEGLHSQVHHHDHFNSHGHQWWATILTTLSQGGPPT